MNKENQMMPSEHPIRARLTAHRSLLAGLAAGLALLAALATPPPAAAAGTPAWNVNSVARPTNFAPGDSTGDDLYLITLTNVGDGASDGSPVTITDNLPAGLTAASVELWYTPFNQATFPYDLGAFGLCTTTPVQCQYPGPLGGLLPPLAPGDQLQIGVHVSVDPSAAGALSNSVTVAGGGGPTVTTTSNNATGATAAPFGINGFSVQASNRDGSTDTQAGSHPYALTTSFALNTDNVSGLQAPAEDAKDIAVDLPPGLIGNPRAAPECSLSTFNADTCPPDAQVGTATIELSNQNDQGGLAINNSQAVFLVYNVAPQPGQAAELGLEGRSANFILGASVRTGGDYGLHVLSAGTPMLGIAAVSVTIWGVPEDPGHTNERPSCMIDCSGVPSGAPARPFLSLPTACPGSSLTTGIAVNSYQHPSANMTAVASMPAITGCEGVPFDPTLALAPDTSQAGAPAGLAVDLGVPQSDNPVSTATADLRDATVTLPAGMTLNPAGAAGLAGCSDAQIALTSPDPGSCPDASKIGSVLLHTPLLDHPLPGDVFLGTPQCDPCTPGDAASGRMVRLFIQVNDPVSGVVVKLPGTVSIDQQTGQVTTRFLQNPQLPFDDLKLNLWGGPRAPLTNPTSCGLFTTTSDLSPWSAPFSGPDATPSSSFNVTGCGDPNTFAPTFAAGSALRQAGDPTNFELSFTRTDSDQELSGLSVTLPPGLTAKLAGVPLCSDADANAGTCPASSQVGTVQTGAGAGSEPLFLPGKAFLTGPYKGGPYGIAVAVPAIAGPFNLGMVVVRQALYIDPTDAHVTVVSDPFPQQLDGIPLRLRRVDVSVDRPDFMLNPTSCDPMQVDGKLTSTAGMTAPVSSRFQVGGCGDLGFSPKLAFKLTGKGQTHSGQHPTLTATLTDPSGQANIRQARVALPLSLALDPNNSQDVCNYDVAQAVHGGAVGCPSSTIVGTATAVTPLLDKPLTGNVYLVQGIRFGSGGQRIRTLPSLLIPLRGQIALDLRAQSAVNGAQQLVTTFSTIPDAPVSKFTLQINGGRKGLLVITGRGKTICGKAQIANGQFGAQSGKTHGEDPRLATPACRGYHRRGTPGKK